MVRVALFSIPFMTTALMAPQSRRNRSETKTGSTNSSRPPKTGLRTRLIPTSKGDPPVARATRPSIAHGK